METKEFLLSFFVPFFSQEHQLPAEEDHLVVTREHVHSIAIIQRNYLNLLGEFSWLIKFRSLRSKYMVLVVNIPKY